MKKILGRTLIIIIILIVGLGYWYYFNPYSDGERKGTLIKFTRKGNVFKTYEGELWLSCRQMMNPEKFFFSVTDERLADSLMKLQDECLTITYRQYRRSLAWRGDSKYIVTGYQRITDQRTN